MCGKEFFLDAADRQHFAAKRYLAGHGDVVTRPFSSVSAETIAVAIVIPALGPSFGIAPSGTWICRSFSRNIRRIDTQFFRTRADTCQCRACRFLHDLAELSGQRDLAFSV